RARGPLPHPGRQRPLPPFRGDWVSIPRASRRVSRLAGVSGGSQVPPRTGSRRGRAGDRRIGRCNDLTSRTRWATEGLMRFLKIFGAYLVANLAAAAVLVVGMPI